MINNNMQLESAAYVINGEQACPINWVITNKQMLDELLLEHGGVLLRNFKISSVSEFNKFSNALSSNLLDYIFRSSPRTKLGNKIYTSTEYPADRTIPLHNENSYTNAWPNKIMFFCAIAPTISGGETPIADSRKVLQCIDSKIIAKFEQLGVQYVRNYIPGIDLSWQEVFQTDDKQQVEEYCKNNSIEFAWDSGVSELATKQTLQATLEHPVTKQKSWFNQAHLFHRSAISQEQQETMLNALGINMLPRNTYYGDGSEIEEDVLQNIRAAYAKCETAFAWQTGDILVLDNILMAHGRRPYQGDRKIVVSMAG